MESWRPCRSGLPRGIPSAGRASIGGTAHLSSGCPATHTKGSHGSPGTRQPTSARTSVSSRLCASRLARQRCPSRHGDVAEASRVDRSLHAVARCAQDPVALTSGNAAPPGNPTTATADLPAPVAATTDATQSHLGPTVESDVPSSLPALSVSEQQGRPAQTGRGRARRSRPVPRPAVDELDSQEVGADPQGDLFDASRVREHQRLRA